MRRQDDDVTPNMVLDGLVPAHRMVLSAIARELRLRDPDGTQVGTVDDLEELGRQAADRLFDDVRRWHEHLGGCYDVEGVRRLLSHGDRPVSRQAVSKRRSLLALTTGSGRVVYPAFQFRGSAPIDGLGPVLAALPEALVSRWTVASWLVSPNRDLDDERPIDVLADGYAPAVVTAARRWAAALAA